MTRLVRGADGRKWTVRTNVEWSSPAGMDEFEHDVSGGHGAAVLMATLMVVLTAVLIIWTPAAVIIPPWLILALALVFLFFPLRWVVRRPWTVVAETPGELDDAGPERWVGNVRGYLSMRQEAIKVARDIEVYSSPAFDGPLQPVD
ncbi:MULTISPECIES: DUF983 domain-containing protein [unclassified Crossiella]|uniref:DUF983 domain-containing protein n=1 Tax=unclassified Crossiella TaxID=2620835 RepID=UPI00207CD1CA|nr:MULTISPECIES: DUF983 domain-containing protein [unclassified Crossiella]MCO1581589.1 DUF983 domain-containing protein [Crossiella sp. SN42]WHT19607.1 DUF983 domain-containing protein [Crossiella sp. CA-258035]